MKKKIYAKRALKAVILVTVIAVILQTAVQVMLAHYDENSLRIEGFYQEEKDSLDVVLIGASDIYAGFSSALAYEEFGFTSYPIATGANPVSIYKSELIEALKRQSPQMIVIEINGALYGNDDKLYDTGSLHKYLDSVPLSADKIRTVNEAVPQGQKSEYLCPFLKYHGVWKDYPDRKKWSDSQNAMRLRGYSRLKGCKIKAGVYDPGKNPVTDFSNENSAKELTGDSEEYLHDLLEYCKENNLDNVLFVRFPHCYKGKLSDRFYRTNRAEEIIREYGFDFINYEKNPELAGIDFRKDFSDAEHLNVYGQKKMTSALGKTLCENYGVHKRELSERQKALWDESLDYTKRFVAYVKELTDKNDKKWYFESTEVMEKLEQMPSQT